MQQPSTLLVSRHSSCASRCHQPGGRIWLLQVGEENEMRPKILLPCFSLLWGWEKRGRGAGAPGFTHPFLLWLMGTGIGMCNLQWGEAVILARSPWSPLGATCTCALCKTGTTSQQEWIELCCLWGRDFSQLGSWYEKATRCLQATKSSRTGVKNQKG